MSEEKNEQHQKNGNFIKSTSKEVNDFFGHTVDSAGRIIKTVSGEGGLVGKATDASGRILKGAAGKANDVIGKTSEVPGNFYKKARGTGNRNKHDDENQT